MLHESVNWFTIITHNIYVSDRNVICACYCDSEVRMLTWMSGVTNLDRLTNDRSRGTAQVEEISTKVQERRLKR